VFEVASSDLVNMGITVVSYTLKDIRDEEGYLKVHILFTVFYPFRHTDKKKIKFSSYIRKFRGEQSRI
jgi:hypothetical protein